MKASFIFLAAMVGFQSLAQAEIAVQRTVHSSYSDYKKYLEKNKRSSFVDAYIQLSSVAEMETPMLERCLEEVYLGAPAQSTCLSAVKALTAKPLNQPRREVLFSFLSKLEKFKSPNQDLYQELRTGLLRTHAHLSKSFKVASAESENNLPKLQDLEMRAWRKALGKMLPLQEVSLLINGKKISKLEQWSAPEGSYQWALVTNTHEPFVRIGTFSQFASESLKSLKPLAQGQCQDLPNLDAQKYGLLQLEIFSNTKCIAQFGMGSSVAKSDHLGNATKMVDIEESSYRHWLWPTLALVGVGLAVGLQGKTVTVEMPSLR